MNILTLSAFYPPDTIGGYEWAAQAVLERLRSRGHTVTVLAGRPDTPCADEAHVLRQLRRVQISPSESGDTFAAKLHALQAYLHNYNVILRTLRATAPDVLYIWAGANLTPAVVAAAEAAQAAGTPIVYHFEDMWLANTRAQTGGTGLTARLSRAVRRAWAALPAYNVSQNHFIHVSESLRQRYDAEGFRPASNTIVHNGYDGDVAARAWDDTPPTEWHLGYAGRLHPNKGVELLLDALTQINNLKNIPFRLSLCGTGDPAYVRSLQEKSKTLGLADHLDWRGVLPRAALLQHYSRFDLLLVPSLWEEPFGLVALEAMAKGVPVLATRRGGLPEIVTDACGWLSDATPDAFEKTLRAALSDYKVLRQKGAAAAKRVRDSFGWEDKVDCIETVLKRTQ